jgi:hypothetical protein
VALVVVRPHSSSRSPEKAHDPFHAPSRKADHKDDKHHESNSGIQPNRPSEIQPKQAHADEQPHADQREQIVRFPAAYNSCDVLSPASPATATMSSARAIGDMPSGRLVMQAWVREFRLSPVRHDQTELSLARTDLHAEAAGEPPARRSVRIKHHDDRPHRTRILTLRSVAKLHEQPEQPRVPR